jgi:NAD(P)-dependent dehydrogenase (short-subunit alcohol dehydrogenase family)
MSGSFPSGGLAVVVGASGGIGAALLAQLQGDAGFAQVLGLSRRSQPGLDLLDEASIAACAHAVAQTQLPLRLLIDATGSLHSEGMQPEKSWQQIDAAAMAQSFAINAMGPALLMKHFLPLLPREGKSVFATLSAKVGSIGDNRLGGWYSYRASKAALNQLVRTAAIELRRRQPQALCVALHPGTVATALSAPFAKAGLEVRPPHDAAQRLLAVLEQLGAADSGGFFNHDGTPLPW